jgi:hypothetical protein
MLVLARKVFKTHSELRIPTSGALCDLTGFADRNVYLFTTSEFCKLRATNKFIGEGSSLRVAGIPETLAALLPLSKVATFYRDSRLGMLFVLSI